MALCDNKVVLLVTIIGDPTAVDQFDQLRFYHDVLPSHRKTWRPLFSLLLKIILVSSFKLSTLSDRAKANRSGHQKCRLKFVRQLENAVGKVARYDPRSQSVNNSHVQDGVVHVQGQ